MGTRWEVMLESGLWKYCSSRCRTQHLIRCCATPNRRRASLRRQGPNDSVQTSTRSRFSIIFSITRVNALTCVEQRESVSVHFGEKAAIGALAANTVGRDSTDHPSSDSLVTLSQLVMYLKEIMPRQKAHECGGRTTVSVYTTTPEIGQPAVRRWHRESATRSSTTQHRLFLVVV
jgi:hypothetical protein